MEVRARGIWGSVVFSPGWWIVDKQQLRSLRKGRRADSALNMGVGGNEAKGGEHGKDSRGVGEG